MTKQSKSDISNQQIAEKIDQLAGVLGQLRADIPDIIQAKIDDLAETTQRGFTAMQEQNEREHAEMRAENAREHEETRQLITEKADLYEVVKHPEFDRLEQRVTQLELK